MSLVVVGGYVWSRRVAGCGRVRDIWMSVKQLSLSVICRGAYMDENYISAQQFANEKLHN